MKVRPALDRDKYTFNKINGKTVYSNVTALTHIDENIKSALVKQMFSPVRWRKTIENMIEDGFDTFVEIGPGKTLSGFMRSINREKTSLSVGSLESLNKTLEILKK